MPAARARSRNAAGTIGPAARPNRTNAPTCARHRSHVATCSAMRARWPAASVPSDMAARVASSGHPGGRRGELTWSCTGVSPPLHGQRVDLFVTAARSLQPLPQRLIDGAEAPVRVLRVPKSAHPRQLGERQVLLEAEADHHPLVCGQGRNSGLHLIAAFRAGERLLGAGFGGSRLGRGRTSGFSGAVSDSNRGRAVLRAQAWRHDRESVTRRSSDDRLECQARHFGPEHRERLGERQAVAVAATEDQLVDERQAGYRLEQAKTSTD